MTATVRHTDGTRDHYEDLAEEAEEARVDMIVARAREAYNEMLQQFELVEANLRMALEAAPHDTDTWTGLAEAVAVVQAYEPVLVSFRPWLTPDCRGYRIIDQATLDAAYDEAGVTRHCYVSNPKFAHGRNLFELYPEAELDAAEAAS